MGLFDAFYDPAFDLNGDGKLDIYEDTLMMQAIENATEIFSSSADDAAEDDSVIDADMGFNDGGFDF